MGDKITHMNRILTLFFVLILTSLACSTSPVTPAAQQQPVTMPSGTVLFQDDFNKPIITGWDRFRADEGIMDYNSNGYRILVNALNTNFWATPRKNFRDVRIEVDSGKIGGPDENRIGIVCRYNTATYYFFMITSDGFYGVGIYAGGQAVLLGQNELQTSTAIKTGLAVNHLRADCAGNVLTFYINGFQVSQVQDSTLATGDVGVLAGTFDTPGVDVIFDNFVVLQP